MNPAGVVSLLEVTVRPGREDELVRVFAELRVFERAGGRGTLRRARLLRPVDESRAFLVLAEWDAPESYRAWLDDPVREEVRAAMEPLLAGDTSGDLFIVAEEWSLSVGTRQP